MLPQIHTPDSSRYWLADTYEKRHAAGQEPMNIDKEFLRLWFRTHCDPYKDKVSLPQSRLDICKSIKLPQSSVSAIYLAKQQRSRSHLTQSNAAPYVQATLLDLRHPAVPVPPADCCVRLCISSANAIATHILPPVNLECSVKFSVYSASGAAGGAARAGVGTFAPLHLVVRSNHGTGVCAGACGRAAE